MIAADDKGYVSLVNDFTYSGGHLVDGFLRIVKRNRNIAEIYNLH